ncbi:glycosyltransferase family 2 protein [Lactococcus formosensis]|uniref:glycosyltransferase family 2 protein n=1 Tax=Lactococcus formosensis TaxID=1281486 RepID=UPI0024353A22|nr:glycosyltransferase [Lactococcus formosensis]MDG6187390.1 glycosyltransferase [Lactococcus formosensis]
MKDFLDKWEILLELEEDYQDVTWQGEYIYPYIRTKLYGILHRDYNYLDNNTKPLGKFAAETLILEKQLSAFFLGEKEDTKCDILYVPFYRFKFDGSDFIDERSDLIYKDLKNQNLDVIRLIYKAQSPFLPSDKNTYYMDDINKLVDERAILFDEIQSEELEKLYRLQKDIQEKLNIRFVVDDYLKEFGNRAIGYREYLRRALEILKPKAIVLPASYLFSDLVIVAHEQGIPVIDVQYAALTNAHVGYNFKSQSRTFPDVLLGWGRFWDRKEVFGTQRYTFIPVGKKQDFDVSKEKNSEKIVFISQNLITKFIFEEAMKFAGNFPSYEVIIKLHPNDNYPEILKEQIKKYNNIKVITKGMDKITDAQYVVGVGSSLLYELISSDTKVIILDNYMKAFMRGLAEKENVYFVKDLVKDFSKICNYNFNEVINLNQNYETIDYKKIIRTININHENSIPTVSGEHVNFDVFKIKDMLNNVGTLTIENFGNSLTSVKSLEEEYLLSIVVGVFNDEDNVELLFKSLEDLEIVKNQTAEVIFIDAGSKDKTVSKIEEKIYGRKNIHVYKGNPNSPTSALQTRKRGTLYSKGEYVYYLDGDDFISPFNLDIAAIYLSKYRVDLLKGSVNVHFTDNDSLTTWRLPYSYIDKKYEFTNDVNLSLPLRFMHNHIYRKDLINLDNFDKVDIKVSEDHYFNDLQYLDMKKVAVLPLSFNVYRKRTEGTESTKEYTEEKYYTSLKAFLTVLREFDESKVWNRDSFIKYINKVYIKGLLDTVPQLPNTTSDIFSNRVLEMVLLQSLKIKYKVYNPSCS